MNWFESHVKSLSIEIGHGEAKFHELEISQEKEYKTLKGCNFCTENTSGLNYNLAGLEKTVTGNNHVCAKQFTTNL